MASKMHAIEHIVRTKLPKRVHKQEILILPIDFANSKCHKQPQNEDIPCNWRAWEALFDMIIHLCSFQNHAPQLRREADFQKKRRVKHELHKENNRLQTKFTKLQAICIPSFLQTGLGGENSTGLQPQAVFEGGKKRTHSEPNEQKSDKCQKSKPKSRHLKA